MCIEISNLPLEIQFKILKELPLSEIRSYCQVSTMWLNLIENNVPSHLKVWKERKWQYYVHLLSEHQKSQEETQKIRRAVNINVKLCMLFLFPTLYKVQELFFGKLSDEIHLEYLMFTITCLSLLLLLRKKNKFQYRQDRVEWQIENFYCELTHYRLIKKSNLNDLLFLNKKGNIGS